MSTYTQILYQFVFTPKYQQPVLIKEGREKLFKYMWNTLKNKKCHPYAINGVENHIHILTHVHPSIAVSDLIKDLKVSSSIWIKEENIFPDFISWQVGYGAFTYSQDVKKKLINYINNQEEHHLKKQSLEEEYIELLKSYGIEFDMQYLF